MSENSNQVVLESPGEPGAPKKSGKRRAVLWLVGIVVLLVVVAAGWYGSRTDPDNAEVGDCITGSTKDDLKVVDCADTATTTKWKIVDRLGGQAESEFREKKTVGEICTAAPNASRAIWIGEGVFGYVLCLERVAK